MDNEEFRLTKFFQSDEHVDKVAAKCLQENPNLKKGWGTNVEEETKKWIRRYRGTIKQILNQKRGYVGDRMKVAVDYWKANIAADSTDPEDFPTYQDVKRCADRNLDLQIDESLVKEGEEPSIIEHSKDGKLFWWYVEHLTPKTVGREGFNENTRHYETITEAKYYKDGKWACLFLLNPPNWMCRTLTNCSLVCIVITKARRRQFPVPRRPLLVFVTRTIGRSGWMDSRS